jgi:streptogramin lyase
LAAAAVILAAAAAVGIVLATDSGGAPSGNPAAIGSSGPVTVLGIDPSTGKPSAQLRLIGLPYSLAAGRLVWAANRASGTLSAIDPPQHAMTKLVSVGGFPSALAVGKEGVWVFDAVKGLLSRIDPSYQTVAASVRVAPPDPSANSSGQSVATWGSVADGEGAVWLTDGSSTLTEVDPATSKVERRIDVHIPLDGVTTGDGAVWAISGPKATLLRLDRSGKVTSTIAIVANPGPLSSYPESVAVGDGYVWVLNGNTGTVTKVDPGQQTISATIQASSSASGPQAITFGNGAAWVGNSDGTIVRIDARTNAVTTFGPYAEYLHDVASSPGTIWATIASSAGNT